MSYGHAERNLVAIRQLEAETRELLLGLDELDPEQAQWLKATAPLASEHHGLLAAECSAIARSGTQHRLPSHQPCLRGVT